MEWRGIVLESAMVSHPLTGMLPDFVLRRLIRSRLASQLRELYSLPSETQFRSVIDFVKSVKQMPVFVKPDVARDHFYDISPELFKLFLGKRLKYSSYFFSGPSCTPDEAEEAMLQLYCERAQIQDGHKILDVGGGYGSVAFYIAERFPSCEITSISYSRCHTEYIQQECRERGLTNVKAIDGDIVAFESSEPFDRILGIGILEHVKNHQKFLTILSNLMKPDGLLFIEHTCHKHFAYSMAKGRSILDIESDVISETLPLYFQDDVVIVDQWRIRGTHIGRACDAWIKNLDSNSDAILSIFVKAYGTETASKRLSGFRTNLLAGSETFNFNGGQEWIISHKLFQKQCTHKETVLKF